MTKELYEEEISYQTMVRNRESQLEMEITRAHRRFVEEVDRNQRLQQELGMLEREHI